MIINTADRLQNTKEYYFSTKLKEVRGLKEEGKDILNMGIGSPDLPPSKETIDTLIREVRKDDVHGYQPYKGIAELRQAMANWYQKTYHVQLDPDHEILPLIGSKEGITHISLTFLNPGDEVLVPELGYPSYKAVSEMVGARVRYYPLKEDTWEPDFNKLDGEDLGNVKIMWVNYPHMPTGAPANIHLFENIIEFAYNKSILICHDNPYSLILNEGTPISLLSVKGAKEVCLELNSMSKSHNMAGWRIGWLNGDRKYLDEVIKIKSNVDSGMFYPIQKAAAAAFNNTEEFHKQQNDIYRERREIIYQFLDKLKCQYRKDQVGLFVWAKLPDHIQSTEKFIDHLLYQYHLFISPGFVFGSKGDRFIRTSLCNDKDTLLKALKRIENINMKELKL